MTSSTDTRSVIVLGDKDTGTRLEMLKTRAAECGVSITETHTFEGGEAAQQDNLADVGAAFTALCQAVRTRSNIWLPFPLDVIREEHARRLSLVLQRHGLELLIGRNMWACPRDSGISEIDGALRREVRVVDDLDRAVLAALGGLTLTDEIESMLRADAIVRCALDLGLRSSEIAQLNLDDIDWEAGTITLRRTKGRREDVMPLPEATGRAIALYLRDERPKTQHRMVFARHMTPRERPIGPDLVRKTIRQAYARAGLAHTRSHLLRHTMASRLLASGSSLKEVADVLRHRSLNTTLIYAKLDGSRLVEVALPWPGTSAAAAAGRLS